MEIKAIMDKVSTLFDKYRYAILILLIGLALMLIPGRTQEEPRETVSIQQEEERSNEEKLEALLSSIKGVGRVEVLLSYAAGERTMYQSDTDAGSNRSDTIIITDADRNQNGLVTQILSPVYQGAVIVCQGAENPSVRLAVVDAVSKFTGLGTDKITVLEMK